MNLHGTNRKKVVKQRRTDPARSRDRIVCRTRAIRGEIGLRFS